MIRLACKFALLVLMAVFFGCSKWNWGNDDVILSELVSPTNTHKAIVALSDPGPLDSYYTKVIVERIGGPASGDRMTVFEIAGKPELSIEWFSSGELKITGDFSNEIIHKTTTFSRTKVLYQSAGGSSLKPERN